MSNKSNKTVSSDGEVITDVTDGAEIPCPTCKGKGKILDPKLKRGGYGYVYMHEADKYCECRTCSGSGWVFVKQLETIFAPMIEELKKVKR